MNHVRNMNARKRSNATVVVALRVTFKAIICREGPEGLYKNRVQSLVILSHVDPILDYLLIVDPPQIDYLDFEYKSNPTKCSQSMLYLFMSYLSNLISITICIAIMFIIFDNFLFDQNLYL